MDSIDRKILIQLQRNAKQNTKEIADKVGLTISPTSDRIKKLEKLGYIKGYKAILEGSKIGFEITVYCQISLSNHSRKLIDNFKEKVLSLSEVIECHHLSGNYDFLLKVGVPDMNEYQNFVIDKLSVIDGISNVQSSFVMQEIKGKEGYTF